MSTIAAIATALGNSAINIVRLSGEASLAIAQSIFSAPNLDYANIVPRYMYLGELTGDAFHDKCLMVCFRAPHSYTGEDLVEFHCHGGVRIAQELLRLLLSRGALPATKGEYSKRAFINGKMTLSQAEGVIEMITAESAAALNCGYRLMSGHLNTTVTAIKDTLLDAIAQLEAAFDYPDELEDEALENGANLLQHCLEQLNALLSTADSGRYVVSGINIAIVGQPNSGKSSLLNALTNQDKAIVTDIAGTTRDTIEGRLEYQGILFNFIDTAGIRSSQDTVEQMGIAKAYSAAESADVVLILLDGSTSITQGEQQLLDTFSNKPHLVVINKVDLSGDCEYSGDNIRISAKNRTNIDTLLANIKNMFVQMELDSTQEVLTNVRHIELIQRAQSAVAKALACYDYAAAECTIVDMNDAYYALGEITGDSCSEDVIDRVFQKFCLGK